MIFGLDDGVSENERRSVKKINRVEVWGFWIFYVRQDAIYSILK